MKRNWKLTIFLSKPDGKLRQKYAYIAQIIYHVGSSVSFCFIWRFCFLSPYKIGSAGSNFRVFRGWFDSTWHICANWQANTRRRTETLFGYWKLQRISRTKSKTRNYTANQRRATQIKPCASSVQQGSLQSCLNIQLFGQSIVCKFGVSHQRSFHIP